MVVPIACALNVCLTPWRDLMMRWLADPAGLSVWVFHSVVAVAFLYAYVESLGIDLARRQPQPIKDGRHANCGIGYQVFKA